MARAAEIERRKRALIAEHGPWTAHNIALGEGVFTIASASQMSGDERRLRRLVQLAHDLGGKPLADLRVLDLACLEGLFAIEIARLGATVVGIEGRAANVARARFARETLGLERLTLLHEDVRELSRARHGGFDVVICSGILYHLDAPDVFRFAERVAEVCDRLAIVDTQVSLAPDVAHAWREQQYHGHSVHEHHLHTSAAEREAQSWASLDNVRSFWLSRPSLYNLLADVGFSTVCECHNPSLLALPRDRVTLAALKAGATAGAFPLGSERDERWPEQRNDTLHPNQQLGRAERAARRANGWLPSSLRDWLRRP